MKSLNNEQWETLLETAHAKPSEAWYAETLAKLESTAGVSGEKAGLFAHLGFFSRVKVGFDRIVPPRRRLPFALGAFASFVLLYGAVTVLPTQWIRWFAPKDSVQYILVALADEIRAEQKSDRILHLKEKITECDGFPFYPDSVDESGCGVFFQEDYRHQGDIYSITTTLDGEVQQQHLERNGWSYTYSRGDETATKYNQSELARRFPELKNGSELDYSATIDKVDDALLATQNKSQKVSLLGEEMIGGRLAYKISYLGHETPTADFGLSAEELTEGQLLTTFWVDKESYRRLKYAQGVIENGVEKVLTSYEYVTYEYIDVAQAEQIFQYEAPAGIEIVDLTAEYVEQYEQEKAAGKVAEQVGGIVIAKEIAEGKLMLVAPSYVPDGVMLERLTIPEDGQGSPFLTYSPRWWDSTSRCSTSFERYRNFTVALSPTDPRSESSETGEQPDVPPTIVDKVKTLASGVEATQRTTRSENGFTTIALIWKVKEGFVTVSGFGIAELELIKVAQSVKKISPSDREIISELQHVINLEFRDSAGGPKPPVLAELSEQVGLPLYTPPSLPYDVSLISASCYRAEVGEGQPKATMLNYQISLTTDRSYRGGDVGLWTVSANEKDFAEILPALFDLNFSAAAVWPLTVQQVPLRDTEATLYTTNYGGNDARYTLAWMEEGNHVVIQATLLSKAELFSIANDIKKVEAEDAVALSALQEQLNRGVEARVGW